MARGVGGRVQLVVSTFLIACTLLGAACFDRAEPRADREAKFRIDPSYVGAIAGTDAFIGIGQAPEGSQVLAFLTDGLAGDVGRKGAASEWFVGAATGPDLDLSSRNGVRLQAKLGEQEAQGTVSFQGGRSLEFTAERAKGDKAGLYREEASVGDTAYLLGWIVLNNGKERGASTPPFIRCQAVLPSIC